MVETFKPDTETQKKQLLELKKIHASLPDTGAQENQLEELKKLNIHILLYDKIIVGIAVATLILSLFLAIK
jgi:hypothetical protein